MAKIFFKIFVLSVVLITFANAATLNEDTFDSNTDGWSGSGVSWYSGGWLFIDHGKTASKTYDFGSSYANQTITITLYAYKTNNWESNDKIRIYANGSTVYNSNNGGTISFDTTFDGNGKLVLKIKTNTSSSNEDLYIDYVTIEGEDLSGTGAFSSRYETNLMGNMKVIGNTVLCPQNSSGQCIESGKTGSNISNAQEDLRYVDVDSNSSTFNSSSATLEDDAIVPTTDDLEPAKIVWAGLYWSGYLHTDDAADRSYESGASFAVFTSQYSSLQSESDILTLINNHQVQLTVNGATYTISGELLGTNDYYTSTNYSGKSYAMFADITSLLEGEDPRATYTVANIPSMEGVTNNVDISGFQNKRYIIDSTGTSFNGYNYNSVSSYTRQDGLGNSGAWSIVIIYENTSTGEKTRNAAVFDGFASLGEIEEVTIAVEGFLTPSSGEVDSTLSVFANEGDKYITGDYMQLSDDSGSFHFLGSSSNYFDSSVTGIDTKNPDMTNNQGIDIHTENVGDANSGEDIISNDQTSTNIKIGTDGDYYYPIMVAFATELYKPELCYDYSGLVGDSIIVPIDSNRTFSVSKWTSSDPFYIKTLIRSEEADFDLVNTGLKVILKDTNGTSISSKLSFDLSKTKISPNSTNAYTEEGELYAYDGDSSMFPLGEEWKANEPNGGILGPDEVTYAKAAFDFLTGDTIDGKFDLELHTYLQLNPDDLTELTPYTYSTADGSLSLCKRNYIYDPIWLWFNVEPSGSDSANTDTERYSLLTQIVGRAFDIDIVSYSAASNYETEQTIDDITVDLELINAGGFQNDSNNSFDSICGDNSNAITDGQFVLFDNASRVTLNNFESDTALENAAFRVWILTVEDDNGTREIVPSHLF